MAAPKDCHAPPKRARKSRKSRSTAQHQMAVGRLRAYSPRAPHTKAIAERVRAILHELVPFDLKPTVRHVFYRLVEAHLLPKTEDAYEKWQRQSVPMREGGYIPLDAFIDSSREIITWRLHARPSDALLDAAYAYARDPWLDQEEAVCLVCEAETHKEMLRPLAEEYGVPLFAMKGSASLSSLLELVRMLRERWERHGQCTVLLYCGDHDPAGIELSESLHKRLVKLHMPPLAARVVRVMVTELQIRRHEPPLQTRPPKESDTRTPWYERRFGDLGCVELDAFPPQEVIAAMRAAIEDRITDRAAWARNEEHGLKGAWAYAMWDELNAAHYGGKLPTPLILWETTEWGGCLGDTTYKEPPLVRLHPGLMLTPERTSYRDHTPWKIPQEYRGYGLAADVLLHEAMHVAIHARLVPQHVPSGHSSHDNKTWCAECNRLAPALGLEMTAAPSRTVRVPTGEL